MTAPVLPVLTISSPRSDGLDRPPEADTGFERVLQQQIERRHTRSADRGGGGGDGVESRDRTPHREVDERRSDPTSGRDDADRFERSASVEQDGRVDVDRQVRDDRPRPGPDDEPASEQAVAAATTMVASARDTPVRDAADETGSSGEGEAMDTASGSAGSADRPTAVDAAGPITHTAADGTADVELADLLATPDTDVSVDAASTHDLGPTTPLDEGQATVSDPAVPVGEASEVDAAMDQQSDASTTEMAGALPTDGAGDELVADRQAARRTDADAAESTVASDAVGQGGTGSETGSEMDADARDSRGRPAPDGLPTAAQVANRLPGGPAEGRVIGGGPVGPVPGPGSTAPVSAAARAATTGPAMTGPAATAAQAVTAPTAATDQGGDPAVATSSTGVGPLGGTGESAAGSGAAPTARATGPSPAAARIAELAEQLENRPAPRTLTVELAELDGARVRIAVQAGGVKVTVLDGMMDPGTRAALDRELENALGAKGFDLAGGRDGGGRDRRPDQDNNRDVTWSPPWLMPGMTPGAASSMSRPNRAEEGVRL